MRLLKFFFYSLLLFVLVTSLSSWNTNECVAIGVDAEVTHTTNNSDNGIVTLIFSDQPTNFDAYIIIRGKKEKLKDSKVGSLAKGRYDVIVTGKTSDTKYCPKHFEITIN